MHLTRMIVGEIILLLASVLVFRSLWLYMDQYLCYAYLDVFLLVGLVLVVGALLLINHEVKSK